MVSAFPFLLSWSEVAPLLLRITIAAVFLHKTYKSLRSSRDHGDKAIAVVEGLVAIFLLIGLFTQVAALILAIDLLIRLIQKALRKEVLSAGVNYYILLLIMALCLLVSGPGLLSFDLPV